MFSKQNISHVRISCCMHNVTDSYICYTFTWQPPGHKPCQPFYVGLDEAKAIFVGRGLVPRILYMYLKIFSLNARCIPLSWMYKIHVKIGVDPYGEKIKGKAGTEKWSGLEIGSYKDGWKDKIGHSYKCYLRWATVLCRPNLNRNVCPLAMLREFHTGGWGGGGPSDNYGCALRGAEDGRQTHREMRAETPC